MTTVTYNGVEFNNKDLELFVSGTFDWSFSPEGKGYWSDVCARFGVDDISMPECHEFVAKVCVASGDYDFTEEAIREVGSAVLAQVLSKQELERWKKNVGVY